MLSFFFLSFSYQSVGTLCILGITFGQSYVLWLFSFCLLFVFLNIMEIFFFLLMHFKF